MKALIESAIPTLLRKANLYIRHNEECIVEEHVNNDVYEDGFEIELKVEYNLIHGDTSPEGCEDHVDVRDITMKVNDVIVDHNEYCITISDFE